MADANLRDFEMRIRRIQETRRGGSRRRGYLMSANHDGMIIATVRPRTLRIPIHGLAMMAAALLLFKAMALAQLGPVTYAERLATLQEGEAVKRAGAFVLQPDPVTEWMAAQLRPLLD